MATHNIGPLGKKGLVHEGPPIPRMVFPRTGPMSPLSAKSFQNVDILPDFRTERTGINVGDWLIRTKGTERIVAETIEEKIYFLRRSASQNYFSLESGGSNLRTIQDNLRNFSHIYRLRAPEIEIAIRENLINLTPENLQPALENAVIQTCSNHSFGSVQFYGLASPAGQILPFLAHPDFLEKAQAEPKIFDFRLLLTLSLPKKTLVRLQLIEAGFNSGRVSTLGLQILAASVARASIITANEYWKKQKSGQAP